MMNANEIKKFPGKIVTGGETNSERIEVFGAKAKATTTSVGGFLGAIFMAPFTGAISFITDICALGADVCDCVKGGKGGD